LSANPSPDHIARFFGAAIEDIFVYDDTVGPEQPDFQSEQRGTVPYGHSRTSQGMQQTSFGPHRHIRAGLMSFPSFGMFAAAGQPILPLAGPPVTGAGTPVPQAGTQHRNI